MIDRVFSSLHLRYHLKNFELVFNILLSNGYSLSIIFEVLNSRLKFLTERHNYISLNNKKESQNTPDNMVYNSVFTKGFRLNLKNYKFFRRELNISSLDVKENFFL